MIEKSNKLEYRKMPYDPSPDLSRQPPASRWRTAEILLVIAHDAWNRVTCLNSGSHLLQASGEGFDLLLLLRDRAFQLLHFAVLLQELIEQHRVHRFVADGRDLRGQLPALPVADFSVSLNVTRPYFPFPVTLRISL